MTVNHSAGMTDGLALDRNHLHIVRPTFKICITGGMKSQNVYNGVTAFSELLVSYWQSWFCLPGACLVISASRFRNMRLIAWQDMENKSRNVQALFAALISVTLIAVAFTLQTVSQPYRTVLALRPNQAATVAPTEAPPAPTEAPPAPTEAPPAPTEPPPPTAVPPTPVPTIAPAQPTARPTDVPQAAPAKPEVQQAAQQAAPSATAVPPTAVPTATAAGAATAGSTGKSRNSQILMPVTGGDNEADAGLAVGLLTIVVAGATALRRRRIARR